MNGLTNYITQQQWRDTITTWFVLVDDAYRRLEQRLGHPIRTRGSAPLFGDSEVITVSLIIETYFQGHEEVGYAFVQQFLPDCFPQLLDLDRFNERRRMLLGVIEAIRQDFRDQKLDRSDPVRLVDSAPISLMTYTRGAACRSVVGRQYFGVVTSKKAKVFGFRLHATVTLQQLIDEWLVAPASILDPQVLDALVCDQAGLTLIADKLYNDADREADLWHTHQHLLLPLRKDNQHAQWPEGIQPLLGNLRHRIETVWSTLTTTFNVSRPRGHSLAGHLVRIATCILAHTLSFFMA